MLLAYLINGEPVGIVVQNYLESELNNNPAFIISDTIIDGYQDITSIENWNNSNLLDWSRRRDEISPLFYTEAGSQLQNFNELSIERKVIACKYFLIPYSIRIQIISDEQDTLNWDFLLTETKKSREFCVEAMRIYTGGLIRNGILTIPQTQDFFRDISPMIYTFNEANIADFKNWIFGLSPFEGVFLSKEYYSESLQEKLINIYNGDY